MRDVVTGLVSSVIAGAAVWLGQWLLRHQRVARKRAFFGVSPGAACVLVAPKHFSSPQATSVHRRDMAALVQLATIVNDCGGRADVTAEGAGTPGIGHATEFCVGGPTANPRTAAHLRAVLPGVRFDPEEDLPLNTGSTVYRKAPGHAEYVVLAKAYIPTTVHPVFVIAGQTALSNLAATRLLATQYRRLLRTYRATGQFCLVLKVVEPDTYGADFVQIEADATEEAF